MKDSRRLQFHLMPPVGWLNDPNGLCQFKGIYHVFFQYTSWDVLGGQKVWGHYTSKDLLSWNYKGVSLVPDQPYDKDGVFSGSALITQNKMYLFYTGNVEQEGDYDYVYEGREGNTICVTSEDGEHYSPKNCLLRPENYPSNCSCHIRDPKVWQINNSYYMVLGGRTKNDVGMVLLYTSRDLTDWQFVKEITTEKPFGYMWECPDYININGKEFLSCSPQGVESEEFRFQNVYQSGYFTVEGELLKECKVHRFIEWDMGFDFYAPQTFVDDSGRRILIGWAGMADPAYTNPTTEAGWQHALTVPRELTERNGILYQTPVKELEQLRKKQYMVTPGERLLFGKDIFEVLVSDVKTRVCEITIAMDVHIRFEKEVIRLFFTNDCGSGRTERKAKLSSLKSIRILVDTSLMEIYINEGELVFTTRYYKTIEGNSLEVVCEDCNIIAWEL